MERMSLRMPKMLQEGKRQRRNSRLLLLIFAVVLLNIAAALALYAMRSSASFFKTPSEITATDISAQRALRLGGFVEKNSVRFGQGAQVTFTVTDYARNVQVNFTGILPDLFREGQGVIVEGRFRADGFFDAQRVLAKHDENYVPKDVVERMKKQGFKEGYHESAY